MATEMHARKFTIVSDSIQDHYEVVDCADGPEGIAELNQKYPPSAGWMIVDSADTEEEAALKIEEHRTSARMDFE